MEKLARVRRGDWEWIVTCKLFIFMNLVSGGDVIEVSWVM